MAEQTAHDVVKEALSVGAASSIDATANPSNVAPAGNGQALFTSENLHAKQDHEAEDSLQRAHIEAVGDSAVQAVPEVNLVSDSGEISIDESDIQAIVADASGGSDTDTSKDLKDPATGHVRSNSVKKPTSFKSVSVTKNFLAKTVTTPVAKLSDKGAPSGASPSAALQGARPRLVAKSALGGLARTAATNGTAPDASKVWNKNRPTPPPPPRQFTDEELKHQYGIHMATRLQADEAGKESKWADIDDDEEDWAPETVEWMDGTKSSVVPADAHATPPPPGEGDKSVPMRKEASADSSERGGTPTPRVGLSATSKTILKPGVHLQNLTKSGSPARDGSERSSPASKSSAPMPSKNPWAPLPPIDKVAPIFPQPPAQSSAAPFRRDPHGFESLPPPPVGPAREIAADDFNRTWMDDRGPRELFDSKSGRYEPVGEMRRGSFRHDHNNRQPAVLQRPPTQNDRPAPAEPSAAFQTRSTGSESGNWARRRASSNVSAGSGGRRFSIGRPQDERLDNMSPMRAFAVESPQQQFSAMDVGISPASAGQGSWPQSSPTYNAAQLAPDIQTSPFINGEMPDSQLGPLDEDPVLRQQRLMREKQDATRLRKQREREEEAREEAARKERLRLKLEALGPASPSPELKEPKAKEVVAATSPEQPVANIISPPKPPIPTNDGEVAQYGVMKVHQPHPVRKITGGGADGILSKKYAPEASYSSEHQPTSSSNVVLTGAGKRGESHTQLLNSASWKSPSPSSPYNWGNNSTNNSTNVWGPPQHNNRGLGNGTFNNDYNRISGTINQSSTIDRPGPIAPPSAYKNFHSRSSLTEQQPPSTSDNSQLPEHLIPSNLDSFDSPSTNTVEDKMSATIAPPATASGGATQQRWTVQHWQEAANGGLQAREAEERRMVKAFHDAMIKDKPVQPAPQNFTTVWKQTAIDGSYGKRRVLAVVETDHSDAADKKTETATTNATKATAADSKINSDNLSSTAMAANASQASNASGAASRSSRFFPRQELSSSNKSDSPPPPGNSSLFDDDAAHPKVNLPTPKAVVKLPPPSSVGEQKVVVATATPPRIGAPVTKTPARAQLDDLLQNWKSTPYKASAAPIASASKAPLDVASKEGAKVALPASAVKDAEQSANKIDKQSATVTAESTSKTMASEILLEEREFASRPVVRLPKAPYVNAGIPPVPMKLLNNRPASGRFMPLVEVESVAATELFIQEEKGGIVTIYVKLPGDHQRQPFTRRAPPKSRYAEFANKARRNFSDRRENSNGNGSGNGNGNGNPAPNNGRRTSGNHRGGRFNGSRGNGKPNGPSTSGSAMAA